MSAKPEHYDLIRKPVITEKATMASEGNAVVFQVAMDATKPKIKEAVEAVFGVKVKAVNTTDHQGQGQEVPRPPRRAERREEGLRHPRRGQHHRRDLGPLSATNPCEGPRARRGPFAFQPSSANKSSSRSSVEVMPACTPI